MAFVAVCMSSTALALPVKVVYEAMKGSFTLAADGKAAIVIVDNDDAEVVKVALKCSATTLKWCLEQSPFCLLPRL